MSKRVHPCPDLETTDLVITSEQRTKIVFEKPGIERLRLRHLKLIWKAHELFPRGK